MNVIGIVSGWVHTLMNFAYLTPWLFFVMAVELLYRRPDLHKDLEKMLRWGLLSAGLCCSGADGSLRYPPGKPCPHKGLRPQPDDAC